MLVGGVRILGLYLYGPDGAPQLVELRKRAAAVQMELRLSADGSGADVGSEWLLLHIPFGARKCPPLPPSVAAATTTTPNGPHASRQRQ